MNNVTQPAYISFRKSRFSTRLPVGRSYTASHCWIEARGAQCYRVGFTKFATRMLGDLVEAGMEVAEGDQVAVGEVIGWIECLKAASDLFCVVSGRFASLNPELNENPDWLARDPYGKGWLYQVEGEPEPKALSAEGYAALLEDTIAKMLGEVS